MREPPPVGCGFEGGPSHGRLGAIVPARLGAKLDVVFESDIVKRSASHVESDRAHRLTGTSDGSVAILRHDEGAVPDRSREKGSSMVNE